MKSNDRQEDKEGVKWSGERGIDRREFDWRHTEEKVVGRLERNNPQKLKCPWKT
jgi:hypothetical protein